jgi:SAM-dependent methyltransferase
MFEFTARKIYYFGPRYQCSVCNSRTRLRRTLSFDFPILSELDVVGSEYISEDHCPVCDSGSRERLLHAYLKQSGLAKAERVLNVAPDRGIHRSLFRRHKGYVAIDLDPARYRSLGRVAYGDLTNLRYADRSFDLVLCSHVLEHIPDDTAAMSEIARVLSLRGRAILQVPFAMRLETTMEDPSVTDLRERERRYGRPGHVRIYGADYFDRLRAVGLDTQTIAAAEAIAPHSVEGLQVNPRERIFLASRI